MGYTRQIRSSKSKFMPAFDVVTYIWYTLLIVIFTFEPTIIQQKILYY